jgi:hypothetical protein
MQPCVASTSSMYAAQSWTLNQNGFIQTTVKNSAGATYSYCLDAGINPSNGIVMKVWTCFPGYLQQTWNFASYGGTGLIKTNNSMFVFLRG